MSLETEPITRSILMTALDLFGHQGFRKTTLRAVAKGAGVSRPTVYARFRDKESLFNGVIALLHSDSLEAATVAMSEADGFAARLECAVVAYFSSTYALTQSLPLGHQLMLEYGVHADQAIREGRKAWRDLLRTSLQHAQDSGEIAFQDVDEEQVLDILVLGPLSFKSPQTDLHEYQRRLAGLARLVAAALSAGVR